MKIIDTIEVKDALDSRYAMNLKDLNTVSILDVDGGKLIIKELPDFPPIDCSWNGCIEFAEYMVIALDCDEETLISFHCSKHHDDVLENVLKAIPFFIIH